MYFVANLVVMVIQNKFKLLKMIAYPMPLVILIISVLLIIDDLSIQKFNWQAIKDIIMSIPLYFTVLYGLIWFVMLLAMVVCHKVNVFPELVNVLRRNLEISRSNSENVLNLVKNNIGMFGYLLLLLILHYSAFNAVVFILRSFMCFGVPYIIIHTINNTNFQLILNK